MWGGGYIDLCNINMPALYIFFSVHKGVKDFGSKMEKLWNGSGPIYEGSTK